MIERYEYCKKCGRMLEWITLGVFEPEEALMCRNCDEDWFV